MKKIKASSFYASIHQQLYFLEESEHPLYIEMVHNTDDDQLTLVIIFDPTAPEISEFSLGFMKCKNWEFLFSRFGSRNESMISNIETVFKTNEFHVMVRQLNAEFHGKLKKEMSHQLYVPGMPK